MEFATKAEYVLFYIACISSGLLLIKIIMMWAGGDFDGGNHDFVPDAGDSDGDFGVFSINAVICFFMAFGWVGLAALREWGFDFYVSLGFGVGGGAFSALFFSFCLGLAKKLNATPEVLSLKKGDIGEVYSKISAFGIGKIRVNNIIVQATSDKNIDSFRRIQVLEDIEINTNAVAKVTTL